MNEDAGADGDGSRRWSDATLAAALLAVDPNGLGGLVLSAYAGPVRERWLREFRHLCHAHARFLPHQDDTSLIGGLDLVATLEAGRPRLRPGLLAACDHGCLIVPMAERLSARQAAHIGAALDTGSVGVERDGFSCRLPARVGVVLLNESVDPGDACPDGLMERCAFQCALDGVRLADMTAPAYGVEAVTAARRRLAAVAVPDDVAEALCAAALRVGIDSLRVPLLAVRAARAAAALLGEDRVGAPQAALAVRLVFGPRALAPAPGPEEQAGDPADERADDPADQRAEEQSEQGAGDRDPAEVESDDRSTVDPDDLTEVLVAVAAEAARLPLAFSRTPAPAVTSSGPAGRMGPVRRSTLRGRPEGARPGRPGGGARLDLLATLRAAAPWQALRRRPRRDLVGEGRRLAIVRDDLHVRRYRQRAATLTLFAVDASGSAAMQRLGEAKGAVELLLADCYVRRDSVALLAFRGTGAAELLPPTRSLVRARRSLAHMVGGGATPLAAGIDAAAALALRARRRGLVPNLVLLTDGRGNVARDGRADREAARQDALAAADRLRALGVAAMLVDLSPRGQAVARELAGRAGATYLPLPHAGARELSRSVRAMATDHAA